MDPRTALELGQNGIQVALMVLLPMLAVALFVGVAVSVFVAVCILLAFLGNWMLQQLVGFTLVCFEYAARVGQ
jgi:flagellar biosynthetic protein FliQ